VVLRGCTYSDPRVLLDGGADVKEMWRKVTVPDETQMAKELEQHGHRTARHAGVPGAAPAHTADGEDDEVGCPQCHAYLSHAERERENCTDRETETDTLVHCTNADGCTHGYQGRDGDGAPTAKRRRTGRLQRVMNTHLLGSSSIDLLRPSTQP
jgi:hypothetical protein